MEIIFELLFEVIGELVVQLLGEAVFKPLWRATGRKVPGRGWALLVAGLALAGVGFAWALHVADLGRDGPPRWLWVSLTLAVLLGLGALTRWCAARRVDPLAPMGSSSVEAIRAEAGPVSSGGPSLIERVAPWRWSAGRLAAFAATNAALALGLFLGHLAA